MHDQVNNELSAKVIASFVSLVEKNNYLPGERLPSERELAERFLVGRGVVREAFSTLENLRFIERKPNSGVFLGRDAGAVSLETLVLSSGVGIPISPRTLSESLEVRRIIEMQAVGIACQRRTVKDVETLTEVIQRWDQYLSVEKEVADLDYLFHIGIFHATQNIVFVRLVTPFYIMSKTRREMFFSNRSVAEESNAQHKAILAAIVERDEAKAASLMSLHIGRVEHALDPKT